VLLFLISKNKLNIYDIPIAELLTQYLAYLGEMREMDLDITSEFLEMASRLVQIKSALLLPKREDDDADDPREDLVTALIEYKTCKAMAEALRERNEGFNCFVRKPMPIEFDQTYRGHHEASELYKAYLAVKGRIRRRLPPPVTAFHGIVDNKIISVGSRIIHVIRMLVRGGSRRFNSLFDDSTGRSEAVATFLAVLELVKSRKIVIEGEGDGETVRVVRK
jgi:segregation and condensation protein A